MTARDPKNVAHRYVLIVRRDETSTELAELLRERIRFEQLLADLSARFSRLPEEELDAEIEVWLRRIVELLGVDRSSFVQWTPTGQLVVTHVYAAPGTEPPPKTLADDRLPWVVQELRAGRDVVLSRLDDVPEQAVVDPQFFEKVGQKAGIGIPLDVGER